MRLLNFSREKWCDQTTLQTHAAKRRLDGGVGGVFEFTVPTLAALMGPNQKDAELACTMSNVRI